MNCIHQMMLVNQGVHWCKLQKDCYPDCDKCQDREEPPISFIEASIETSDWLTRGIPEKKLAKEKDKAIKKANRWSRRHKKEVMRRALVKIASICVDYSNDKFSTVEGLKSLIGEIGEISKIALVSTTKGQ